MISSLNIKIDDTFFRDDYISDDDIEHKPESETEPKQESYNRQFVKKNTILFYKMEYEYYPNGALKTEKLIDIRTNKAFGPFREYYPSGTVWREGYMINNTIQNQLKTYYPSGSIATFQEYDDGYLNGTSILYYESGMISRKLNYRLVTATCDNKHKDYVSLIDGDYYEFDEDSRLMTHVIYKRGFIDKIKYKCKSSYIIPSSNYTICM